MRISAETYAIAYAIHLSIITPWFPSLDRLQQVREVFNLFDVGSSDLKKCLLSCTSKARLTDLTVGTHDHVDMDILGCTLHVPGRASSLIMGLLIGRIALKTKWS